LREEQAIHGQYASSISHVGYTLGFIEVDGSEAQLMRIDQVVSKRCRLLIKLATATGTYPLMGDYWDLAMAIHLE
jgi:hypothetical protein